MSDDFGTTPWAPDDLARPIASQIALMRELGEASVTTGRAISDAFARGIVSGKRFDDVLGDMGRRLSTNLLRSALRPLDTALGQVLTAGLGALGNIFTPSAAGRVMPFADGGIVAQPTYFSMGRNLGLMGERGAEAILPLARGPDGKLGVSAGGSGRGAAVTVNISTPDAASFRQSQGMVEATIARAVARGRRSL